MWVAAPLFFLGSILASGYAYLCVNEQGRMSGAEMLLHEHEYWVWDVSWLALGGVLGVIFLVVAPRWWRLAYIVPFTFSAIVAGWLVIAGPLSHT